jgi:hypothetical protein
MRTLKLLIEFGFWSTIVIGLIIVNSPLMAFEIFKDRRKKHNEYNNPL